MELFAAHTGADTCEPSFGRLADKLSYTACALMRPMLGPHIGGGKNTAQVAVLV